MLALALTAFGVALTPPVSDDARWVALQRTARTVEVRDDVEGLRRILRVERGCGVRSVSRGGVLLIACPAGRIELVDLSTGAREQAQTPVLSGVSESLSAVAAGRRWIAERHEGYHFSVLQYRDRVTGEVRLADGQREYPDLDADELVQPFCSPLVRFNGPSDPYEVQGAFRPLTYDGHVGYAGKRFWRCGEARPRRIARARGLTAGGGWVTWVAGREVHVLRLRDGRRVHRRVRPGASVIHTARAVYVTRGRTVHRARLPR
jgi:hypothetical protein